MHVLCRVVIGIMALDTKPGACNGVAQMFIAALAGSGGEVAAIGVGMTCDAGHHPVDQREARRHGHRWRGHNLDRVRKQRVKGMAIQAWAAAPPGHAL